MLPLLLVVLAQSLSPSPLVEARRSPLEESEAVSSLRSMFESNVLSVEPGFGGVTLRRGTQRWQLDEDEWPNAFALVPELHREALTVRDRLQAATTLMRVGLAIELGGLAGALGALGLAVFTPVGLTTVLLMAIVSGCIGLTGAVVGMIPLPAMASANQRVYELVGLYNRQLARVDVPVGGPAVSIPLP